MPFTPYGSGQYGQTIYGSSDRPSTEVVSGHILMPEARVRIDGTIRDRFGFGFGFDTGTGTDLGLLRNLSFTYTPRIDVIDAPDFATGNLFEIGEEVLTFNLELYEFDPVVIRKILPNWRVLEYDDKLFASVGGRLDVDSTFFKNMTIELMNCSYGTVPDLETKVRGLTLTFYKVLLTTGITFATISPKDNISIPLTFTAVQDMTRNITDRLCSLVVY